MDFIVLDDSKEMRRLEIRKHIIKKILDEPNVKLKRRYLIKLKIGVLFILGEVDGIQNLDMEIRKIN